MIQRWVAQPTRIHFGDSPAVVWIGVRRIMYTPGMWRSSSIPCHPSPCWSYPFGVSSYASNTDWKRASTCAGWVSVSLASEAWHSMAPYIQLVAPVEHPAFCFEWVQTNLDGFIATPKQIQKWDIWKLWCLFHVVEMWFHLFRDSYNHQKGKH